MDHATAFLSCIRPLLALGTKTPIELHTTNISFAEHEALRACLEDGQVSTAGPLGARFEAALKDYTGAGYVIATSSGSAALHLALLAHGVIPGDEVLVPSLAYIAPANTVALMGAVPHFVECEAQSMGIDAGRLTGYLSEIAVKRDGVLVNRNTNRVIRAMIPVHSHGMPGHIPMLAAVAKEFGLALIEDAAEAIGSYYQGRHVGSQHTAVFSFNGNKVITAGGGGAVVTHDPDLAVRMREMANVAKIPHSYLYAYSGMGYNYGMPSLNAALAIAQLSRVDTLLDSKRRLAAWYRNQFAEFDAGDMMVEPEGVTSNYWQSVLVLHDAAYRNMLIEKAQEGGVKCRGGWTPLHQLPFFQGAPRDKLTLTESLSSRMIILPSATTLMDILEPV
jgi:perosamine synthetase